MNPVDLPILDPAFKADPYAVYEGLRQTHGPVVRVRLPTGVEGWLVVAHALSRTLLADARLSKRGPTRPPHPIFEHLLTLDPPAHTRLRSIAAREFSSQRVRQLRPRVTAIAVGLIEGLRRQRDVDLIEAFALPFPLTVICELLGLPRSDEPRIQRWSERLLEADLEHPEQVPAVAKELQEYLLELAARRRGTPDTGLFGAFVAARDRQEISDAELTAMAFLLLVAGHETTVNLIGNGVVAMLRNRSEWTRLCADPALAGRAVEELLRYDSPLEVATPRYAVSELTIGDARIAVGDLVFVGLGASNRDAECFHSPGRLDITRSDAGEHLAFGYGIHFCLGAALARLEGEVAFAELAARYPDLDLAVAPQTLRWKPGLIMRGLERLPVRT